jgi:hypothetical protein
VEEDEEDGGVDVLTIPTCVCKCVCVYLCNVQEHCDVQSFCDMSGKEGWMARSEEKSDLVNGCAELRCQLSICLAVLTDSRGKQLLHKPME